MPEIENTDPEFWKVLNAHFGFKYDLACSASNCLCPNGITKVENSLHQPWNELPNWQFLNPPPENMGLWVDKCYEESKLGAKIVMLTQAETGSTWFKNFIWGKARIRFLSGNMENQPSNNLMISMFEPRIFMNPDVWEWRKGWE